MKLIPLLAAALILAACGEKPTSSEASAPAPKGASYKVQLTFTPRTLAKLKDLGEKVTVSNWFYGIANKAVADAGKADGVGQIQLDETLRDVEPQNQIVTVAVPPLEPAKLANIEGRPLLLINVASARKKHADNLLNCGVFDAELEKAEAELIKIECDLIEPEILEPQPEFVPPADRS